jgi:hypothetical protein
MDLDSLILHFFGTEDPATLTEAEFERALERLKIGFGVEREPGRRFALWVLLEGLRPGAVTCGSLRQGAQAQGRSGGLPQRCVQA